MLSVLKIVTSNGGEAIMSQSIDYVLVVGYGWSGSSAVVDLLNEFDTCWQANVEFRVIKDPYGIHDLHHAIVENWDSLNLDIAIKDFWWHMEHLNHVNRKFSFKAGLSYKFFFGDNFLQATQNFLDKIISYKYKGRWWFFDFKRNGIEFTISKVLRILKLCEEKMYFSCVSDEEFCNYAQEYIDELFGPLIVSDSVKHVILDQAVHIRNYSKEMKYIRNSKLIVVDRDPRDIYADLIQGKNLIGRELAESHDVMKYVGYHRAYRKNQLELKNDPNVLFIQFEDLVCNYEDVVNKMAEFLKLDLREHMFAKKNFDPAVSVKNIGIWKNILSEQEEQVIKAELGDYIPDEFY